MIWMALTVLYKIMPNANVRWRPAVVGGVVAGSAFVFLYGLYLKFQVGVAQANAIYATLAALPLLLIYLQLAWTVVIAGAEVAYAVQNLQSLRDGKPLPPPTPWVLRRLGWLVVSRACDAFRGGQRGIRLEELAMELDVPEDWLDTVAQLLIDGGVLVTIQDDELVMPARPPEQVEWRQVIAMIDGAGDEELLRRVQLPDEAELRLAKADEAMNAALAGRSF
jgi:membrane protein